MLGLGLGLGLGSSGAPAVPPPPPPLSADVVNYYKFDSDFEDEVSGDTLTGNGTLSYGAGVADGNVTFGGGFAKFPEGWNMHFTDGFTIAFWEKRPADTNQWRSEFDVADGTGNSIRYYGKSGNGYPWLALSVAGVSAPPSASFVARCPRTVPTATNWNLWTVSFSDAGVAIFLNGDCVGGTPTIRTETGINVIPGDYGNTADSHFLSTNSIPDPNLAASFSGLVTFDRYLKPEEVSALYNSGNGLAWPFTAATVVPPATSRRFAMSSFGPLEDQTDLRILRCSSADLMWWEDQTPISYTPAGGIVRDPDICKFGSDYFICHTNVSHTTSTTFSVARATASDLSAWTEIATPTVDSVASRVWAPTWVKDQDGSTYLDPGDGRPRIVVMRGDDGETQPYLMVPTNDALTTWDTPVVMTGTAFTGAGVFDPFVQKRDNGDFRIWWKDSVDGHIHMSTADALVGDYDTDIDMTTRFSWVTTPEAGMITAFEPGIERFWLDNFGDFGYSFVESTDDWATVRWATINQQCGSMGGSMRHGHVIDTEA